MHFFKGILQAHIIQDRSQFLSSRDRNVQGARLSMRENRCNWRILAWRTSPTERWRVCKVLPLTTKHPKTNKPGMGKERYLGSKHTPYWENRFFLLFLCSYTSPDTDGYFLHRSASNSGKKNVSVEISLRLLMVIQYIQLRDKLKINTVNCRIKHSKQIYRLILDEQLVL